MKKSKRFNLLPNPKLQGALLVRVALYWLASVLVMLLLAFIQALLASSNAPFDVSLNRTLEFFGPALLSSFCILPFLLVDAVRFSVRFTGPLKRLTNEAHRMASGQNPAPINFRENDYFHELTAPFNAVAAELKRLRALENDTQDEAKPKEAEATATA